VALELCGAPLELALARLERLRTLERGPLAGDERLGVRCRWLLLFLGLARLPVAEALLEAGELPLTGGDRLRALAEGLFQPLELDVDITLLCASPLSELAREAEQRVPVEVDARVVGRVPAAARRPRVEPFFPAVYAGPFRQTTLTMYGRPPTSVRQVSQSISMGPSAAAISWEPVCTGPCCTFSKCGDAWFGLRSPTRIVRSSSRGLPTSAHASSFTAT